MKCPICEKDLEIFEKKVNAHDDEPPIVNNYAVCRDCQKQWPLKKKAAEPEANDSYASTDVDPLQDFDHTPKPKRPRPGPKGKPRKEPPQKGARSQKPRPNQRDSRPGKKGARDNPKSSTGRGTPRDSSRGRPPATADVSFGFSRMVVGIFSIVSFCYFAIFGLRAYLDSVARYPATNELTAHIVIGACYLIAGLFLLILKNNNTNMAFIFPAVVYLIGGVYTMFIYSSEYSSSLFLASLIAIILCVFLGFISKLAKERRARARARRAKRR